MIVPKQLPLDCIFEGVGELNAGVEGDAVVANPSDPIDEVAGVQRWSIDKREALRDLQRVLRIDAAIPQLASLQPTSSVTAVSHHTQPLSVHTTRDAAELLASSEKLLQSLGVESHSTFAKQCEDVHRKVRLLQPGYASELLRRVEETMKEAIKWGEGRTDVYKEISCTDEQLRDVVQLVQFLHHDVAPSVAPLLNAAKEVQTMLPLLAETSDRVKYLSILLTPNEFTDRAEGLVACTSALTDTLRESEQACDASLASFAERLARLQTNRRRLR